MKKIIVPTDFSPVADNATSYAIEIAAKFNCELYFYHVYSLDRVNYDLNYSEHEQPYTREVERNMSLTKLKFQEKINQYGLHVKTVVERGDTLTLFKKKVKKHDISLVVMGSKGASGITKKVFGSVAATAIAMSEVPVLVVPPMYSFHSLKQIVLAIDNREVSPKLLLPLRELAKSIDASVAVVNVDTGSNDNYDWKSAISFEGLETTYQEIPMTGSINKSLNEFMSRKGSDLLCMVRRKKGVIESIFKKSITRAQVFDNQVPLLVLPE